MWNFLVYEVYAFAMPLRNYNAQTINLRNLIPYYIKEGSQNGDGGH
jgi:hypothetical protein